MFGEDEEGVPGGGLEQMDVEDVDPLREAGIQLERPPEPAGVRRIGRKIGRKCRRACPSVVEFFSDLWSMCFDNSVDERPGAYWELDTSSAFVSGAELDDDFEDPEYIDDVIGALALSSSLADAESSYGKSSPGSSSHFAKNNNGSNGGNHNHNGNHNKNNGAKTKPILKNNSTYNPAASSPLSDLPIELVAHIISFVASSVSDLAVCARVCRTWRILATDQHLWKKICFRRFSRDFWQFPKLSDFDNDSELFTSSERGTSRSTLNWITTYSALGNMLRNGRNASFTYVCPICQSKIETSCVMKPATFLLTYPGRRILPRTTENLKQQKRRLRQQKKLQKQQQQQRKGTRRPIEEDSSSSDEDEKPRKGQPEVCEEDEKWFEDDDREFGDVRNGGEHRLVVVSEKCKRCHLTQRTSHPCEGCFCARRHSSQLILCADCKKTFICMIALTHDEQKRPYCGTCDRSYLYRTMDDQFGTDLL